MTYGILHTLRSAPTELREYLPIGNFLESIARVDGFTYAEAEFIAYYAKYGLVPGSVTKETRRRVEAKPVKDLPENWADRINAASTHVRARSIVHDYKSTHPIAKQFARYTGFVSRYLVGRAIEEQVIPAMAIVDDVNLREHAVPLLEFGARLVEPDAREGVYQLRLVRRVQQ